ncbi:LysE family translocator [Nisaea acidiphila]|uniref:LysE family translocator n=1 Tax=Nisaea acidiphila TaxID=1862145 RepID=A0A9J7AWE9_9PROT|nr:LysE family translocator [Nisaea acidiphila]UUX50588.1 LysE family translocator [Nisaea acidiphila]
MTLFSALTLFLVLAAMAALPSSSVALVVARSAVSGVPYGLAVSLGIVAGDLIFIALAVLGMTALAAELGAFFALIRYAAAAYLVWFGISLIRGQLRREQEQAVPEVPRAAWGGLPGSFVAGLLLTLGDVKAIFFYASLLPTFLDLAALSSGDIALLSALCVAAVGSVKVVYAFAAQRLAARASGFAHARKAKMLAGGFFVAAGGYLALKG